MQREPEIVKILREEERLRNLQTKSCSSNETIVTTEDKPVHETEIYHFYDVLMEELK